MGNPVRAKQEPCNCAARWAATLVIGGAIGCSPAGPPMPAADSDSALELAANPDDAAGNADLGGEVPADLDAATTLPTDTSAPLDLADSQPDLDVQAEADLDAAKSPELPDAESDLDAANSPELPDSEPDLDAGGDICTPSTEDVWEMYGQYPNCAVGCSCFGSATQCPVVNGCCGFLYGGCWCDQSGKIACLGGSSALCDTCMLGADTESANPKGPGDPCQPGVTPPSCWGKQALACKAAGANGKLVEIALCDNGSECLAGLCVSSAGTKGVVCPPANCAALGFGYACLSAPGGPGVCAKACGICQGSQCFAYPQSWVAGRECVGPLAQAGDQAMSLAKCASDIDCATGLTCKAFTVALAFGAKYAPPTAKVCVPANW